MQIEESSTAELVVAVRSGDQAALDELIALYLPLVYNIVGRALQGHADVDDVVQETFLRVVAHLDDLREPSAFRSWLVAITSRQIRSKMNERGRRALRHEVLEEARGVPAVGSDFADLSLLRLHLSGQRRQIVEATAWLDPPDRELLSLWWLEVAGELSRADLAAALDLTPAHAAVRVQRMKAQLEASRSVVAALGARPRCPELEVLLRGWDGRVGGMWRKRIARHTRDCVTCNSTWAALVPAEQLISEQALVPLPVGFVLHAALSAAGQVTGSVTVGALAAKPAVGAAWMTKMTLAVVTGAAVVAGAGAVYVAGPPKRVPPAVARSQLPTTAAVPDPARTLSHAPSAIPTTPRPSPSSAPARYGSVIDRVDSAPHRNRKPGRLPKRAEGTLQIVSAHPADPRAMLHRGDFVTLRGKGYIQVVYQAAYTQRTGTMVMPSWTGLRGRLFHVASGGGYRLDDARDGGPANHTFMGQPDTGYILLPQGAQQMWEREYFYVDGQVTLHQNERGADYNLYPTIMSWQRIHDEINTPPSPGGALRYGLSRDGGTDAAPVPQYVTRAVTDPALVRQHSRVS